ncbi:MAG TPA: alpha/beta fold hydrolase [Iamia sp.]|nr:alpha/beta fold hydrolase [Iamia sp.]
MPEGDDITIVLVHGGGATGRTWDRLVPLLARPACAVDLPGRGDRPADLGTITVADEVASVVADAEAATDGRIALVAHSSGGLVVPGVAAALGDRLAGIVLIAALVPPEGGCGLDCMKPAHREGLVATVEAARAAGEPPITLPGAPADPEPFRTAYGGDPLTDDELAFVVDPTRCVPDTVHHYFQPVHWSMVGPVPVTYVHTTRDRPVRPEAQREMTTRLPAERTTVVELATGHLPMVTDPAVVADVIGAALRRGSRAAGR